MSPLHVTERTKKMKKTKDIYYFSSTHWDREWYQTFQGFRYRLVKLINDMLEIIENDKDFGVFHFDGQTIVLEDYAEIEPEKVQKLKALISSNKIKIGPWYVMPDEFLLSGESLIRNLMTGHRLAKQWGAKEAWKFGYICDIFGHIAQMPQIFNGFGIKYSLLCRGDSNDRDPYFIWKSPDGSECITFRMGNKSGYGEYCRLVIKKPELYCENSLEEIKKLTGEYIDFLKTRTKHPLYVIMDGFDHEPLHSDTTKYIKMIKEYAADANVHHVDLIEAGKKLREYYDNLDIREGELNRTAKQIYPQLITNTLSSYYPLKQMNDRCQNTLEKFTEPLLVYASMNGIELNRRYIDVAYKYLIKNHPHDSICGCSIDQVHKDMEYRFDQTMEICDTLKENYLLEDSREYIDLRNSESDGILTLYNTLPFDREEVISVDLGMKLNYPATYQELFGYELINSFKILDCNNNEIPYQVINIKRNQIHRLFNQISENVNIHTITFKAKVPAGGKCEYRIVESETPSRYLKHMKSGMDYMENNLIKVRINQNGTISIFDKKTKKLYDNQLNFADDAEIGDGWYHANPKNDRMVFSGFGPCSVEKIESGCSRCVFRIIKTINLPKKLENTASSKFRSNDYEKLTAVFDIGLSENTRFADVNLRFENNIQDHRLRLAIPTFTHSKSYFAGQAFYCCNRKDDIDYSTQNWCEPDQYEKSMNGIVGKRDKHGLGIAFISAEGLHECSCRSDENNTIYVTLLRSFSSTVLTNGETRCQLNHNLSYKFILAPIDNDVSYSDLVHLQDILSTGIMSTYTDVKKNVQLMQPLSNVKISGRNICTSIIKRAEDRSDSYIIRLFNASDNDSTAYIEFNGGIASASEVNLNEEDKLSSNILLKDGIAIINVSKWHIISVKITQKCE